MRENPDQVKQRNYHHHQQQQQHHHDKNNHDDHQHDDHSERHPLEDWLGTKLLRGITKNRDPLEYNFHKSFNEGPTIGTRAALHDKDLILLYFSAGWHSSCQRFTKQLEEFYRRAKHDESETKKHDKKQHDENKISTPDQATSPPRPRPVKLEVIYVSADRDTKEFETVFDAMPWLAVDFISIHVKSKLTQQCHATKIPTLVVIRGATGLYVTDQGCEEVATVMENHDTKQDATNSNGQDKVVQSLLQHWMSTESVPLEDATFTSGRECTIL